MAMKRKKSGRESSRHPPKKAKGDGGVTNGKKLTVKQEAAKKKDSQQQKQFKNLYADFQAAFKVYDNILLNDIIARFQDSYDMDIIRTFINNMLKKWKRLMFVQEAPLTYRLRPPDVSKKLAEVAKRLGPQSGNTEPIHERVFEMIERCQEGSGLLQKRITKAFQGEYSNKVIEKAIKNLEQLELIVRPPVYRKCWKAAYVVEQKNKCSIFFKKSGELDHEFFDQKVEAALYMIRRTDPRFWSAERIVKDILLVTQGLESLVPLFTANKISGEDLSRNQKSHPNAMVLWLMGKVGIKSEDGKKFKVAFDGQLKRDKGFKVSELQTALTQDRPGGMMGAMTPLTSSGLRIPLADIRKIIQILEYDGVIEEIPETSIKQEFGYHHAVRMHSRSANVSDDEFLNKSYRSLKYEQPSPFSDMPCQACPNADICHDHGRVSPSQCEYLAAWLE